MTDKVRIRKIARERFGYEDLRKGQEAAIASVLEGRDTLAVMPTGSGKSAICQIAGLLLDGPTVVVSPLIALQKDQLDTIEEQEVAPAAVLNSVIPESERREAFEHLHVISSSCFLLRSSLTSRKRSTGSSKLSSPCS